MEFYLNMEHIKQLQIGVNSSVAAQFWAPLKMQGYSTGEPQSYSKTKEITVQ